MGTVAGLAVQSILADRYRILNVLGSGGMGAVYLAEDLKLPGKRWAIKESRKQANEAKQFIEEAELLIQLQHPFLPNIIDYYPPDRSGYSYLVMDYIEGQTLQQSFETKGQFIPVETVVHYSIQLCELLTYLHQYQGKPIIYRDLKPSNVMIDLQNNIRLIDFGIARSFKADKNADTIPLGTIGFAAPEQFAQQQTDHRSDLYSLGAMMYYLLSGGQYYYLTRNPLQSRNELLPAELIHIIHKLLMEQPEHRYQNALQVKMQLMHLRNSANQATHEEWRGSIAAEGSGNRKMIVVGSLHRGAGSTFVGMAIARVLHAYRCMNAFLEYPIVEPQLYDLLGGDSAVPERYPFLHDQIRSEALNSKVDGNRNVKQWQDGYTSWYPLHPDYRMPDMWSSDWHYKMLYSLKSPFIIVDVSTKWTAAEAEQLFNDADEIVLVASSDPYLFNSHSCRQRMQLAMKLRENKKPVHFIANRQLAKGKHSRWNRAFPWRPICVIPNLPYEKLVQAAWRGMLVQDELQTAAVLLQALKPLLVELMPKERMS